MQKFLITFFCTPEKLTYEQIFRISKLAFITEGDVMEVIKIWTQKDYYWVKSNNDYVTSFSKFDSTFRSNEEKNKELKKDN